MHTYEVTVHIVDYYGYPVCDEPTYRTQAANAADARKQARRGRLSWPRYEVSVKRVKEDEAQA